MASSNREPRQRFKANKSEGTPSGDDPPRRTPRRIVWILAAIVLVCVGAAPWLIGGGIPWSALIAAKPGTPAAAAYVGSETCAGCHQTEAKLWQTSQHKKAMAHATDRTVLGDFSGATFDYRGRDVALLPQGWKVSR